VGSLNIQEIIHSLHRSLSLILHHLGLEFRLWFWLKKIPLLCWFEISSVNILYLLYSVLFTLHLSVFLLTHHYIFKLSRSCNTYPEVVTLESNSKHYLRFLSNIPFIVTSLFSMYIHKYLPTQAISTTSTIYSVIANNPFRSQWFNLKFSKYVQL
jgi:hypothetical protein